MFSCSAKFQSPLFFLFTAHVCAEDDYYCPTSKQCISKEFVCDGLPDCLFGEDEMNCTVCPTNQTHCNQTHCLPRDYFCDGHDDCGDGSDETGCCKYHSPSSLLFMIVGMCLMILVILCTVLHLHFYL